MATSTIFLSIFLLYTFLFSISSASTSTSEVDILLTFKNSINDPKNFLSNWSNTTSIHHCNWTGVICSSTVSSLTLQNLNLSGEISSSICKLPNLLHLNLADNFFNQPIPIHLSECASLETLDLSNNLIWGPIPEQISQFSSLNVLDFSKNHIEGKIPESIGSLKKLRVLNLGSNLLSGSVPLVLGNFTELLVLDLSQNSFLISEIPSDVVKLNNLEKLLLQSSGFYGEIPEIFEGLQSLLIFDVSKNNLSGELPRTGLSLPKLISFDVSQNSLVGSFPINICESKSLIDLSLHTNFFNGSITNESINKCVKLEKFQVQNNMFKGDFPSELWSLSKIKLIRAENNRFSGEIPNSISQATELEQVQIDNNTFTSKIPQGIGLLRNLYRFSASQNGLYGEIPSTFCDSPVMSIINLSHNYLNGEIPKFKNCKKLVSLSLADNYFIGKIPESLSDLPVLTYLDLSHNNLSGQIPPELQTLKLALFNVSFNYLSGKVPLSLVSGLPASYLEGNPNLCGSGLPKACPNDKPIHKTAGLSKLVCTLISITLAASVLILAIGFYFITRKSKKSIWRSVFFYPLRVNENDLSILMNEKGAFRNSAAFGRVYRVSLPSGEIIAVKKLEKFGKQSSKELKNEIKTLAKIRHKNITKILGFCYSDESILLIYEYLENGSLGDLTRKIDFHLPWSVRLKIAMGIAQGLAYLHKDYSPCLLHRNIKSENILLDLDFDPKLTDFALDRILGEAAFESIIASECSSSCYLAPEYSYTKKATEQMDTYSYGVILLELVTGHQAEESEVGIDVVKWVRRKINICDGEMLVLDPKISSITCRKEMLGVLEIALRCTSVGPEKRPSMFEVVRALQSIDSRSNRASLDVSSVPV